MRFFDFVARLRTDFAFRFRIAFFAADLLPLGMGLPLGFSATTIPFSSSRHNHLSRLPDYANYNDLALKEAAVVRMPSAYGVPAKPNSLANLLESKEYGESL